jgi:hypothetical protein
MFITYIDGRYHLDSNLIDVDLSQLERALEAAV